MLKYLHKLFKLFIIFSVVLSGWTSVVLLTNTTFKLEIKELIDKMYMNQKIFLVNVMDLSILLLKDANERFSENNQSIIIFNNSDNHIDEVDR